MLSAVGTSLSNNGGGTYSNEKFPNPTESEVTLDLPSSGFFHSDYKKHEDLKQMLDSNKDGLKLEAMKRIIGMIAKGKDASDLFPAVVKNVVSKNIEVKKLVYVYLVRYAEDQQDLALLSISTFQRALKDPNQLIRASALRVLSSIRVSMIVPIVMLAIKESASDMSPYVRKTAAHAIPKLFSLDPEQKEELVNVLEKLLSDKTTLVVGSAVMAFEEVCPERVDLIHKNYRKFCNLLVDVDEWGQVVIVNMLTRYARTQFLNPNQEELESSLDQPSFYDTDSESSSIKKQRPVLDSDHRLLLRNAKPLLQSRNAAVVMAVAQLYYHTAPQEETVIIAKALIRLLRSHREVQIIVLTNIASISVHRKGMFEPFLKSFFVRTSDPTRIKLLKLDILTNLASESNINIILREFQTYISSSDKEFVGASIQAIGRCASNIEKVADTCLNGLVSLLSNRDEAIVAESVVVIKKLLQTQPNEHKDIITHMAKLMDFITIPQARASILWLLGEYSNRVPKIAPDVLRKIAKTFTNEQDIVKLQALIFAIKLYLKNPHQTSKFCEYIFQLAKYDQNYDIRDRARFLKYFLFPEKQVSSDKLINCATKIFLAHKPAPTLISRYQNTEFQLGTLSHYLNMPCNGYKTLMSFPKVQPDVSVRNVPDTLSTQESVLEISNKKTEEKKVSEDFYGDNRSMSEESRFESTSESSNESSETDSDTSDSYDSEVRNYPQSKHSKKQEKGDKSDTTADSDQSSDEGLFFEYDAKLNTNKKNAKKDKKLIEEKAIKSKSNVDLLLDLEDVVPIAPVMMPNLGEMLSPNVSAFSNNEIKEVSPLFIPVEKLKLLNRVSGQGLELEYRFTRSPHLISDNLVNIELIFTNTTSVNITNIHIESKNLPNGMMLYEFSPISVLQSQSSTSSSIGIDFNDSTQLASFDINYKINDETLHRNVVIKAPIGEIIRSIILPESTFVEEKEKLKGMNEHISYIKFLGTRKELQQKIFENANLGIISNVNDVMRCGACTLKSRSPIFVTIKCMEDDNIEVCVNCEKMVIGSMLLNELKNSLKQI